MLLQDFGGAAMRAPAPFGGLGFVFWPIRNRLRARFTGVPPKAPSSAERERLGG
jgi:hypothetical protein